MNRVNTVGTCRGYKTQTTGAQALLTAHGTACFLNIPKVVITFFPRH